MRFRLVPKSMTGMTVNGHYTLHCKKQASFGAYNENLNKINPHYRQQTCSPMTLLSHYISFMWIFAGERASNDSGIMENFDFQCFCKLNLWNLR